jgi:hypothetical protein
MFKLFAFVMVAACAVLCVVCLNGDSLPWPYGHFLQPIGAPIYGIGAVVGGAILFRGRGRAS